MTTNTLRIIRFSVTPIAMIAITANKAKKEVMYSACKIIITGILVLIFSKWFCVYYFFR